MATETRPASPFESLVAIVASAAAAVGATLVLFHSFLEELVPPIEGAQLSIGMVSFGTMVVLLALSLLIRKRLSSTRQRWLAVLALGLLATAFWAFFTYRDVVRTYVFAYPAELPASQQTRYIRGELHAMGEKRSQGMSIAEAVKMFGGPQLVVGRELLWEESAQQSHDRAPRALVHVPLDAADDRAVRGRHRGVARAAGQCARHTDQEALARRTVTTTRGTGMKELIDQMLDIARTEVGTREAAVNNTGARIVEYQGATWLAPGAWPWCAAFTAWVLREWLENEAVREALHLDSFSLADKWRCRDASAFGWEKWARQRKLEVLDETQKARAGDFVVFDFSHIGLVTTDQPLAQPQARHHRGQHQRQGRARQRHGRRRLGQGSACRLSRRATSVSSADPPPSPLVGHARHGQQRADDTDGCITGAG
jgi:hypothetical protein